MSASIIPFTPGPWYADGDRVTAPDVTYRQEEVTVAWLPEPDADGNFPEAGVRAGNARLIAAAPDLLDAVAWAAAALAAAPPFVTAGGITRDALTRRLTAVVGFVIDSSTLPGKELP